MHTANIIPKIPTTDVRHQKVRILVIITTIPF